MSGEDDYQESVGQFTDLKPALNASQPVHTVTENVGDSESIARAIAERATGDADDFETREEAISHEPSSENVSNGGQSANKDEKDPAPNGNHSVRVDEKETAPNGNVAVGSDEKDTTPNGSDAVRSEEKETAPTPEEVDEAEKAIIREAKESNKEGPAVAPIGYSGFTIFSWAALIVGGLAGVVFQLTKKKKNQA